MRKRYVIGIFAILFILIIAITFIPTNIEYTTTELRTNLLAGEGLGDIKSNTTPLNFESLLNDSVWQETKQKFTTSFEKGTLIITNYVNRNSIVNEVKQEHIDDLRNMCEYIMLNKTITKVSILSGEITAKVLPLVRTSLEDKTFCPSMDGQTGSLLINETIEWVRK